MIIDYQLVVEEHRQSLDALVEIDAQARRRECLIYRQKKGITLDETEKKLNQLQANHNQYVRGLEDSLRALSETYSVVGSHVLPRNL